MVNGFCLSNKYKIKASDTSFQFGVLSILKPNNANKLTNTTFAIVN
nr:hypothetical protein [Mucilaginibacter sp. FT3.2]